MSVFQEMNEPRRGVSCVRKAEVTLLGLCGRGRGGGRGLSGVVVF